jgi:hypothetical protein
MSTPFLKKMITNAFELEAWARDHGDYAAVNFIAEATALMKAEAERRDKAKETT